jgi:UDP-2,4-diacetamido-2,4,6-trideoxy-beta-L-altropyranose hydrolase
MAEMLSACDVAAGAPGTTTWERACLGLPAAYLATSMNQVPLLEHLDAMGFCRFLGSTAITDEEFVDGFGAFLADRSVLTALRDRAWAAVDGRGAERLAAYLTGTAA